MSNVIPLVTAQAERDAIRLKWQAEFDDGARCAFLQRADGPRESGGYPKGFHAWQLERRNAWFAGFNQGCIDRRAFQKSFSHEVV